MFRDLVVSPIGRDLCSGLVESLIQRYLGDSASTDAISLKLREVGTQYTVNDSLSTNTITIMHC